MGLRMAIKVIISMGRFPLHSNMEYGEEGAQTLSKPTLVLKKKESCADLAFADLAI